MDSKFRALTTLILLYFSLPTFAKKPPKLNVGKLLLPHNFEIPSQHVLEVINGYCYDWSSSNADVVTVRTVLSKEECVSKAVVSAISSKTVRQSATVVARDKVSENRLGCEVFVDCISSIEILSVTRKLYIHSDPLSFQVQARNCENDTFSTVNGLSFEWTVMSLESKPNTNPIQFISYADSKYKPPRLIDFWEKQGIQGSSVLVEAVQIGVAKLTAKLRHPFYINVEPAEITVYAFANVFLHPLDKLYLLPSSKFQFKLVEIRYGEIYKELQPSTRYSLKMSATSSLGLDPATLIVTANDYGEATVFLIDRYFVAKGYYQQSVDIRVVEPSTMKLLICPEEQTLQQFRDYVITVKIFDSFGNDIYLPENLIVDVQFPEDCFKVVRRVTNGTYYVVKPLKPGSCIVKASFQGLSITDGNMMTFEKAVCEARELTILEPLTIVPSYSLLPWDPSSHRKHSIDLHAKGGRGLYRWNVSDVSIVELSDLEGPNVTAIAVNKGDASVTVSDGCTKCTVHTRVSVRSIGQIRLLPSLVEAEIHDSILIPVGVYGEGDQLKAEDTGMFSDCSVVNIDVEVGENIIKQVGQWNSPKFGGCRCLEFTCLTAGFTYVTVRYSSTDNMSEAKTLVACYTPLKLLYPLEAVVAIGSSIDLAFEGGPRPWPLDPESYYINVTASDGSVVIPNKINDAELLGEDLHVYSILCISEGEIQLNLSIGNLASKSNPHPVVKSSTFNVLCAVPSTISLHVRRNITTEKNLCPIEEASPNMPFPTIGDIEVDVFVKHSSGRVISNITSLCIVWKFVDINLAQVKFPNTAFIEAEERRGYRYIIGASQVIQPLGKCGHVILTADIIGYRKDIINGIGVKILLDSDVNQPIQSIVEFDLVENAEISPSFLTVFNHPSNKGILEVRGGSGYFNVVTDNTDIAIVQYDHNSRQIEVMPTAAGMCLIHLADLCIEREQTTTAEVHIVRLSSISVQMPDKIEVGNYALATVELHDQDGNILPLSNSSPIRLYHKTRSDRISVETQPHETTEWFQSIFKIKGLLEGMTDLIFIAEIVEEEEQNKTYIRSELLTLQIYLPFSVHPESITIVPGSSYQINATGGLQPYSHICYSVEDDNIAEVSMTGVITGKVVGRTILHVSFFSLDENKEKTFENSMNATANINVSPFIGIKIKSLSTTVQKGVQLPLTLLGEDENGNLHLLNAQLIDVEFLWSYSNPEVISLELCYQEAWRNDEDNCTVTMKALGTGFATISVTAEIKQDFHTECIFQDEILIHVLDKLILTEPENGATSLIMTMNTSMRLRTSRDGEAIVTFDLSSVDEDKTLATLQNNVLISGEHCGNAILTITAEEKLGVVQKLVVLVQIMKTSFIMVSPEISSQVEELTNSAIPVGYYRKYLISYHDYVGRTFHATNMKTRYVLSRYDLIKVSLSPNATMTIEALCHGITVMKLWSEENPSIVNYIMIETEAAIVPRNLHLIVGDVVCFSFSLKHLSSNAGLWSSRGRCLSVHHTSGTAVAVEAGSTLIEYSIRDQFTTKTTVEIKPATSIQMNVGSLKHLSNAPNDGPYRIPVLISRDEEIHGKVWNCDHVNRSTLSTISFTPPFCCSVYFGGMDNGACAEEIFTSEAIFDWKTGSYYCSITSKGKNKVVNDSISDIYIQAYLTPSEAYCKQIAEPFTVKMTFIPAFHVDTKEVIVSATFNSAVVCVMGAPVILESLSSIPSDPKIIAVSCLQGAPRVNNIVKYMITVDFTQIPKMKSTEMYVRFTSTVIRQFEMVNITAEGLRPLGWSDVLHIIKDDHWCLCPLMYLSVGILLILLVLHTYQGITGRPQRSADQLVILRPSAPHRSPSRNRSPLWSVPSYHVPERRNVATYTYYPPNSSLFGGGRRNMN